MKKNNTMSYKRVMTRLPKVDHTRAALALRDTYERLLDEHMKLIDKFYNASDAVTRLLTKCDVQEQVIGILLDRDGAR